MRAETSSATALGTTRLVACVVTILGAIALSESASAQTSDQLFDQSVVHELRLFINSRDLAELRQHYDRNTDYPAELQWGTLHVPNVGVRSRGLGSRSATKLGLRIDFTRYATGRRFLGLKSLVLKNLWQDPSMVREALAMAMFARMGQPAPRESFGRLYINGEYEGLYAIVEDVDDVFLARTLGSGSGYLFEFHLLTPFHAEYLGDNLSAYKPRFEPRTHELESDTTLYAPIADLFRAVNAAEDTVWRADVERHLDLAQFVTHVAIESFLAENDGILGHAGMNNFYMHRENTAMPYRLLAWDKDNTFLYAGMDVLSRADENEVMRRALTVSDLRALFLQTLEACARTTSDDWWETLLNRVGSLIDAHVRADTRKPYTNDEFDAVLAHMRDFLATRPDFVLQQVAKLRR
jgi:spore coat protein CotH